MSTRSINKPEDQLATHADLMAVLNSAAAMIAGLEARIVVLENASREANEERIAGERADEAEAS